jgi:hypothetical protein
MQESHAIVHACGQVTVLQVYRCDHPGCSKCFKSPGALNTHQVIISINLVVW